MTSYERCMAAIHFQQTDRLPTDLHNFQIGAQRAGLSYREFVLDPPRMARMQIEMQQEFGHDLLLVENGTAALAEALGAGIIYRDDIAPVAHRPALVELADLSNLAVTDDLLEQPLVKANLETVRILRSELGNQVMIMGRGDQGPLSLAAQLYGMDRLLIDLLDEDCEADIHRLLQLCTEANIRYCCALLDAGAHITSLGDSTAGPGVLSPQMYETFAMPYEKQVIEAVHRHGGMLSLHICGDATLIIDKMIQTGADILEIDQKTDIAAAYEVAKGRCALLGQVSPTVLMQGTPAQAAAETRRMLDQLGGSQIRGLIAGPGCALGGTTPAGNIQAMLGACRS